MNYKYSATSQASRTNFKMKIQLIEINKICLAEIVSDQIVLNNTQDAVELIANCHYKGAEGIILKEENVTDAFFDLKTRVAGDMLQKFSTYQSRLAIVGNFGKYTSNSFKDFVRESNKLGRINFVSTMEEAEMCFTKTR